MDTFAKLFAMRIVDNKYFGDSNKLIINSLAEPFFALMVFNWVGDKEKKAISEAEITAEHARRIITARRPIIMGSVKGFINASVIRNANPATESISVSSKMYVKLVPETR